MLFRPFEQNKTTAFFDRGYMVRLFNSAEIFIFQVIADEIPVAVGWGDLVSIFHQYNQSRC